MNQELYNEAVRSNILSRRLIEQLLESMNYSSISFINWTVEVLKVIRTRLERGDKITDEVSSVTYTLDSFHDFVKKNFSSYIESQVFAEPSKAEKIYFSLEPCEDGYSLVMAVCSSLWALWMALKILGLLENGSFNVVSRFCTSTRGACMSTSHRRLFPSKFSASANPWRMTAPRDAFPGSSSGRNIA